MNNLKKTWFHKTRDKKKRNGFTLLEMLIVVSIILILSSMAVPRFTSASKQAKVAKIQADLHVISNAAALYEIPQRWRNWQRRPKISNTCRQNPNFPMILRTRLMQKALFPGRMTA